MSLAVSSRQTSRRGARRAQTKSSNGRAATKGTTSARTVRLTVGQALVKFLSVQFSERDGREQRLIPGCFGIFGHGNVCGLGQALEEYGNELPYYHCWNEQAMVHTAAGLAKATLRKQ